MHLLHRFAHTHATDGDTGQVEASDCAGTLLAKMREAAPLHNAEEGLVRPIVG